MKKLSLIRTVVILILIFNILNYFFLAASYTGKGVKECATLFAHTFINNTNLDGFFPIHYGGIGSDNAFLGFLILPILDLYFLFVILTDFPPSWDYVTMPYKKINIICGIELLAHTLLFVFAISSDDPPYFTMMFRGAFLTHIWFISYIVIFELFYLVRKHRMTHKTTFKKIKLNVFDVAVIGILIELALAFFYCPLVNRIVSVTISEDGIKHTHKFAEFFYTEFVMIFKQKNYYSLDGKVEGYPYMIICLIIIVGQMVLAILKPKHKEKIIFGLSLISILVLTIGLCDMRDSIYTHYITKENSNNFFKIVGAGYYFIIALNIAIPCVYLSSIGKTDMIIISTDEIEDIVMNDAKKLEEKQEEHDNVYIINNENEIIEDVKEGDGVDETI
ncbi:MAG: hypothetical protein K6E87_04930 [bacterium]|nr:hypothetical protein [bacterium]